MKKSEEMLKLVAEKLEDTGQEKFKEVFMHTYNGEGYYIELIFNGEDCFVNLHSLSSGVQGKKITDEDKIVDFLKSNNLKILKKFKYFDNQ